MKTILLFLALLSLAVPAMAQQPAIKFYLEDGTTKEYNIDDIDSFAVSRDNLYVMHIYYQDTNIAYYPNEIIQSVKIEKDTSRQLYLNVYIFGYPKPYLVFDIDSIVFKIDKWQPLTIGKQVWMLKNLDLDHYQNGDSIPEKTDAVEFSYARNGVWCYYNNNPQNGKIHGKLYNFYAFEDPRGLIPLGWRIPKSDDWAELRFYLGGESLAGCKLKSLGNIINGDGLWNSQNTNTTNESGFTALPSGYRFCGDGSGYNAGKFIGLGDLARFWNASIYLEFEQVNNCIQFEKHNCQFYYGPADKRNGISVRCIKDGK